MNLLPWTYKSTLRTLFLKSAVPGTEDTKKEAVAKLRDFWKDRCGLRPKVGTSMRILITLEFFILFYIILDLVSFDTILHGMI